jgi:signal transduction histidine kinase
MKRISTKLILLLTFSALIPLILFGILSILTSLKANHRSVSEGNLNVARASADQIELYVSNSINILRAISQNISRTYMERWQKETIIRDYVINFEEFERIYVTDRNGIIVVNSDLTNDLTDRSGELAFQTAIRGDTYRSEVFISENHIPIMIIAVPLIKLNEIDGVIVGEINLINMWNLVDGIRIGKEGYAFVVSESGLLIAHGDNSSKIRVMRKENISDMEVVKSVLKGGSGTLFYNNNWGLRMLGVYSPISSLGWGVIIEQPTREAYATARKMSYTLIILVITFLIVMIIIGYKGGRRDVMFPIKKLIEGTRQISAGNLTQRVEIGTNDEFSELGKSFNQMTERLIKLQDDIRKNERSATFGRIALGLVHDLKHPIKNIENSSTLMLRLYNDEDYRKTFDKTVKREFANINRFLDDLGDLTKPTLLRPIKLNPHEGIEEVIDSLMGEAKGNEVEIIKEFSRDNIRIYIDKFAIERVFKNIVTNAIHAMPNGGRLTIRTQLIDSGANTIEIDFSDTGCGIPPERIDTIFDDYTTTKRKGLGLGLAICRKILHESGGTIKAKSLSVKGTILTVRLPLTPNNDS